MDPIESWMDAESVRRVARQLLSPSARPDVETAADAGFDDEFVGFAPSAMARPVAAPPVESAPEPEPVRPPDVAPQSPPEPQAEVPVDAPAPGPAPTVEPEPQPASEPEAKPFLAASENPEEPRGPLAARMERLREWLVDKYGARGAFVLDRDGEPVLDDERFTKLHFLARSLAQAYRPVQGEAGNVHVKIGSESYLVVVPAETAFGCLVLGVILPGPLEAPAVAAVLEGLEICARPVRR